MPVLTRPVSPVAIAASTSDKTVDGAPRRPAMNSLGSSG